MKKVLPLFVFLFTSLLVFSQMSTMINDTTYLDGADHTYFQKVFKLDSSYFIEGYHTSSYNKFLLKMNGQAQIVKKVDISDSIMTWTGYSSTVQTQKGLVVASNKWGFKQPMYGVLMAFDLDLDTFFLKRYYGRDIHPTALSVRVMDIKETPDQGFILSGCLSWDSLISSPTAYFYPFLMKVDRNGNKQWVKTYTDLQHSKTSFAKISLTPDLGILILSIKNRGSIIKTNALGDIQWIVQHPNDSIYIACSDMHVTSTGSFVIASVYMTKHIPGSTHYWTEYYGLSLLSINYSSGQINWHRRHNPFKTFGGNVLGFTLHSQGDGSWLVSSTASSIALWNSYTFFNDVGTILHYSSNGDSLGNKYYYPSTYGLETNLNHTLIENDGSIVGVGTTRMGYHQFETAGWIFRTNINGVLGIDDGLTQSLMTIETFPNPTSSDLNFDLQQPLKINATIEFYNSMGQQVYSKSIKSGNASFSLSVEHLPSGLYVYRILSEVQLISIGKFVRK